MSFSLQHRVLYKAAEVLGETRVCRRLQAPVAELRRWLDGEVAAPRHIFLAAVDILVDIAGPRANGESAVQAQPGRAAGSSASQRR
jgi:hypothetical protein